MTVITIVLPPEDTDLTAVSSEDLHLGLAEARALIQAYEAELTRRWRKSLPTVVCGCVQARKERTAHWCNDSTCPNHIPF